MSYTATPIKIYPNCIPERQPNLHVAYWNCGWHKDGADMRSCNQLGEGGNMDSSEEVTSAGNSNEEKPIMGGRRSVDRLEQWTKILGITGTVLGIGWTVFTYQAESRTRNFEQRQKAWEIINEHAKEVLCDKTEESMPTYHRNSGQIDAMEFLIEQGAPLNGIGMPCSEFGDLKGSWARMSNAQFWMSNFTRADLDNANLYHSNFNWSTLDKADLNNARLKYANMHGASVIGANFISADLSYASIPGSDLTEANFSKAILTKADFNRSNLTDAIFSGAITNDLEIKDACYKPHAVDHEGRTGMPIDWPSSLGVLELCASGWSRQKGASN
jgi:hypothetical protein